MAGDMNSNEEQGAQPFDLDFPISPSEELDMDSLHILPLSHMPLQTPSLRRARLVKNIRLESMIEMFNDERSGSGQVDSSDLAGMYNWQASSPHPDDRLIKQLCDMKSFDIYTLRIKLRELNVDVDSHMHLKLSKTKNAELTEYMAKFTMPLIQAVYGDTADDINSIRDLVSLFENPNKDEALRNLKNLADKLHITLAEVPVYLQEYGDTYLALSYFKSSLDALTPQIVDFEESMRELMENDQFRKDRRLAHSVEFICDRVSAVSQSVLNRFNNFDRLSEAMWRDFSAESFGKTRDAIRSDHVAIGAVMCGLTVKMDGWRETFGSSGSATRRANFVMSDMMQGMELISEIDDKPEPRKNIQQGWKNIKKPSEY